MLNATTSYSSLANHTTPTTPTTSSTPRSMSTNARSSHLPLPARAPGRGRFQLQIPHARPAEEVIEMESLNSSHADIHNQANSADTPNQTPSLRKFRGIKCKDLALIALPAMAAGMFAGSYIASTKKSIRGQATETNQNSGFSNKLFTTENFDAQDVLFMSGVVSTIGSMASAAWPYLPEPAQRVIGKTALCLAGGCNS